MPDENEQYLSSFWRNDDLSNDQLIKEKTSLAIEKYFYELFKIKNLEIDIRCHKFMEKDFFRIHMDGYAGGPFLKIYYEFFLSLLKFFIKYKILGFLFKDKF